MFGVKKKKFETFKLTISTPRWSVPLLGRKRYKGAKGGRGSGKSHTFAEMLIERHIMFPETNTVCIREIQKSMKNSVKRLVEDKIELLGVGHLFKITDSEIKRLGPRGGIIIFQGMQDHTADSIKSLEGFDIAWVEEAQSVSKRSLDLLEPTIRKPGSEIWFTWNPYLPTDAVDQFFANADSDDDFVLVTANYLDNPFLPNESLRSAERCRINDPDAYPNIWLGEYLTRTDDQVFGGKWRVGEFEITENSDAWTGPYQGIDFGFAKDPATAVRVYVNESERILYISEEAGQVKLEQDEMSEFFCKKITGFEIYVSRADSARPETISFLKRQTKASEYFLPLIEGVKKWPGSVEDGISHMKGYDIVINTECKETISEFVHYKYKTDRVSGDILPIIIDKHNHYIDAIRYALTPMIKNDFAFEDYDSIL